MQIDELCPVVESRSIGASLAKEFDPYKKIIKTMDAILEIAQDRKLYFFFFWHHLFLQKRKIIGKFS